jgi:hypothetical protein
MTKYLISVLCNNDYVQFQNLLYGVRNCAFLEMYKNQFDISLKTQFNIIAIHLTYFETCRIEFYAKTEMDSQEK